MRASLLGALFWTGFPSRKAHPLHELPLPMFLDIEKTAYHTYIQHRQILDELNISLSI